MMSTNTSNVNVVTNVVADAEPESNASVGAADKSQICLDARTRLELQSKLDAFVAEMSYLPPQGSAGWLNRKHIGGSEINIITGTNPFTTIARWISERTQISRNNIPIVNARWGHAFEDVTVNILKELWRLESVSTCGSVPGNPNVAYSPDGITVVNDDLVNFTMNLFNHAHAVFHYENDSVQVEHDQTDHTIEHYQCDVVDEDGDEVAIESTTELSAESTPKSNYSIILLEIKSPPKRMPGGYIPEEYMSQPLTGLCTLPVCDYAMFINGMYRKCGLFDFDFGNNYDRVFHNRDCYGSGRNRRDMMFKEPIAIGLIGVYRVSDEPYQHELIDFGAVKESIFQNLWQMESERSIVFKHGRPLFSETFRSAMLNAPIDAYHTTKPLLDMDPARFFNCSKTSFQRIHYRREINGDSDDQAEVQLIGFLPWKLMKMDQHRVERVPDYVDAIQDDIDKYVGIIRELNELPMMQRIERYQEIFGDRKKAAADEAGDVIDDVMEENMALAVVLEE